MNEATVSMEFLETLIRDSERLAIATNYITSNKYVDKKELCVILGLEKECEEKC